MNIFALVALIFAFVFQVPSLDGPQKLTRALFNVEESRNDIALVPISMLRKLVRAYGLDQPSFLKSRAYRSPIQFARRWMRVTIVRLPDGTTIYGVDGVVTLCGSNCSIKALIVVEGKPHLQDIGYAERTDFADDGTLTVSTHGSCCFGTWVKYRFEGDRYSAIEQHYYSIREGPAREVHIAPGSTRAVAYAPGAANFVFFARAGQRVSIDVTPLDGPVKGAELTDERGFVIATKRALSARHLDMSAFLPESGRFWLEADGEAAVQVSLRIDPPL